MGSDQQISLNMVLTRELLCEEDYNNHEMVSKTSDADLTKARGPAHKLQTLQRQEKEPRVQLPNNVEYAREIIIACIASAVRVARHYQIRSECFST